jgi:hypothetical protein
VLVCSQSATLHNLFIYLDNFCIYGFLKKTFVFMKFHHPMFYMMQKIQQYGWCSMKSGFGPIIYCC